MKPAPAALAAAALAWAALIGWGVLAALTVLVATGTLITVAALTQDPWWSARSNGVRHEAGIDPDLDTASGVTTSEASAAGRWPRSGRPSRVARRFTRRPTPPARAAVLT